MEGVVSALLLVKTKTNANFGKTLVCGGTIGVKKCNYDLERLEDALAKRTVPAQCLKITQNVLFEFFNFGIFHQFLTYSN